MLPPQSESLTVIANKVHLIDVYKCDNFPPDGMEHICNNKLIITGTKSIPDAIAKLDVDSMNMSNHVEFDAPQTSDLAETMVKRLLEGIPLTRGWTDHDLPSLHELTRENKYGTI